MSNCSKPLSNRYTGLLRFHLTGQERKDNNVLFGADPA